MFWRSKYPTILAENEAAAREHGWRWSITDNGNGFRTGGPDDSWWIWHNRTKGSGIPAPCGSLELWVRCDRRSNFVFASETMRTWIEAQNALHWGNDWLDELRPCKYNIIGRTKTEPSEEVSCQNQSHWLWSKVELTKEHRNAVANLATWPSGVEKARRVFGFSGSSNLFVIQISAENPPPILVNHLASTGRALALLVTTTILIS